MTILTGTLMSCDIITAHQSIKVDGLVSKCSVSNLDSSTHVLVVHLYPKHLHSIPCWSQCGSIYTVFLAEGGVEVFVSTEILFTLSKPENLHCQTIAAVSRSSTLLGILNLPTLGSIHPRVHKIQLLFVHRIIRTPLFESWIRHCVVYILAYPTLISTMCFWDEHGSSGWGDIWCTSIPWLCHKSNWVQVVTIYVQKTRMRNFRREKVCATQSCIENRGSVAEEERLASPQPRLSSDLSTRTVLAAISTELQLSSRIKTLP